MHYIEPADRHQFTFMNRLDDLIPNPHPVRILDAIVERIVKDNPTEFRDKGQENIGRKAYSPQTLLKLYLYGYWNGISSSRKLERETQRNIEVIWLLGTLQPDHKTISDYRKNRGDQIKLMSRKFREFLRDQGFITGKRVGVDGTRVKAYARREMLTVKKIEKHLESMQEKIETYLQSLAENDVLEDLLEEKEDPSDTGSSVNRELLRKVAELTEKVEALEKQKQFLEAEGRKEVSPSDPDARLMRSREGLIPAYNAQVVVDGAHKMIANVEVATVAGDSALLEPAVDSLKKELNLDPKEIVADGGYFNYKQIEALEKRDKPVDCYVAIKKSKDKNRPAIEFHYDEEEDEYRCSQGGRLPLKHKNKESRGQLYDVYQGVDCELCALRSQCTTSKKGRIVHRAHNEAWRKKYRQKMKSPAGKLRMKMRRTLVEHPFGTIRYWMGKIPLLLRGKEKVATELHIYITSYNFRRLISLKCYEDIMEMVGNYRWKLA